MGANNIFKMNYIENPSYLSIYILPQMQKLSNVVAASVDGGEA